MKSSPPLTSTDGRCGDIVEEKAKHFKRRL
jgi:hypothetical protein